MVAFIGILLFAVPLLFLLIAATISTKKNGLYSQQRIGKYGRPFRMYKIRSMYDVEAENDITLLNDPRISRFGHFLRKHKFDEIPQIFNVFIGNMSLVGPRPDVPGYADKLDGEDRIILEVRPGITGPATLKYKNEELLLSKQDDPVKFNDEVVWKDKVKINKRYVKNWSFEKDLKILYQTIFN